MIRKIALALGALILVYALYLGWRVSTERSRVSSRVDSIIAAADPADLTLTPRRTAILLRVEDPTFYTNKGLDFATPGAGMTTVSQSLGKRIFFERFRPGFPKGELIVLTRFALYPKVDKQRTLKAVPRDRLLWSARRPGGGRHRAGSARLVRQTTRRPDRPRIPVADRHGPVPQDA